MHTAEPNSIQIIKDITLNVNSGNQWLTVFTLTGTVWLRKLWGVVTSTTTFTNCTAACFDLYDSAATVQLTANSGVLSGMPVGTMFAKAGTNAAAFVVLDASASALGEPGAAGLQFSEALITKKTGATTVIRFAYNSTDAPIAATCRIFAEYIPITAGSSLVP